MANSARKQVVYLVPHEKNIWDRLIGLQDGVFSDGAAILNFLTGMDDAFTIMGGKEALGCNFALFCAAIQRMQDAGILQSRTGLDMKGNSKKDVRFVFNDTLWVVEDIAECDAY